VGEVEPGDVHAGIEHLDEHLSVPAGGSKSANDLGLPLVEIDGLENVLESDATGVAADIMCFYHSILIVSSKMCSTFGLCTWTCAFQDSFY